MLGVLLCVVVVSAGVLEGRHIEFTRQSKELLTEGVLNFYFAQLAIKPFK